jgi:CheY-like chemotaxis protein
MSTPIRPILIVEDSDDDYDIIMYALGKNIPVPVVRCKDGQELVEYLQNGGKLILDDVRPLPALILLDLNLPRMNGHNTLSYIKQSPRTKWLPVVVLTSSANPAEVDACYLNGANSYFRKPVDFHELRTILNALVTYWVRLAMLPSGQTLN